jgi:hypothetical protein
MLAKYDIGPRPIRLGNRIVRGYMRGPEDAWARYLPPIPGANSATSETSETPVAA